MALLFLFFIGYCVAWIIYARRFHALAKYPGPFLASITRLWLVIDVARGKPGETQRRLHRIYGLNEVPMGPIVRIAPDEVAIADPEAIRTIYGAQSGFAKIDFYLPFRAAWGRYLGAFISLDERRHAKRRRIVSSLYSMSNIVKLESKIDRCVQTLVKKLDECAKNDVSIDLSEWVQWYTSDVVGELFFSRMFGFLDGAYDYGGYIGALDLLIPFVAVACVTPVYLRPLFFLGGAMIPQVSRALAVLKRFESAAELCVDQRRCLLPSCLDTCFTDMLQHLFDIVRDENAEEDMEKYFGLIEVRREICGAFIAGSDSTAAAINAILYHLMRTPSAYAKLQKEIDLAGEENKLSENVQYSEAEPLPYLVACCKEGCMIAGEMFPGGTRVGVNAAVVQRDRRIFGEDADSFVPERWFRADAKRMERYMFVVRNPILLKLSDH
ncbi:pisatin demethylase [Stemphylium lycopersici]|uniref:Pisatin demethylase n=1 Tax=Stemphylium lycopersici TaxID=183478 RepID=A0A364NDX6_STELY|nr:pisatin demethylase [Stemphylium lycopersici]